MTLTQRQPRDAVANAEAEGAQHELADDLADVHCAHDSTSAAVAVRSSGTATPSPAPDPRRRTYHDAARRPPATRTKIGNL